jgi:hypothetical protein
MPSGHNSIQRLQRVQSSVNDVRLRSQGGRNSIAAVPPRMNLRLEIAISVEYLERRSGRAYQYL